MTVPICYKCNSPNDLSLKRSHPSGDLYICKPCRREAYEQRKRQEISVSTDVPLIEPEVWYGRYVENHKKLLQHPGNVRVPVAARRTGV